MLRSIAGGLRDLATPRVEAGVRESEGSAPVRGNDLLQPEGIEGELVILELGHGYSITSIFTQSTVMLASPGAFW